MILAREVLVAVGGETVLVVAIRTFLETSQTMQHRARYLWIVFLMACFCFGTSLAALADNVCAICGKEIHGTIYLMTDKVTGEK